jgi:hypothetical protein
MVYIGCKPQMHQSDIHMSVHLSVEGHSSWFYPSEKLDRCPVAQGRIGFSAIESGFVRRKN